ncbi:Transposase, IS4 family protein [Aciduliprofundum boonei T469]|nr:Transposase, IS4 family protein [Aciduliprofundum boonei T469]
MLIVLSQYGGNISRMLRMIRVMDKIRRVMKLKKIPHKSTISRELRRIPELWIRIVLREIIRAIGIPSKFAVDSTGIQISYRSYYYTVRIGEMERIRKCLKLHAAVDIEKKLITNAIVTKWHANDSPYLIPLLEKEKKIKEIYADKGYDSLRNIRFVLSKGGMPYIAIREKASRGLRRRLLKLSKSPEWKKKYSQRRGQGPLSKPPCFYVVGSLFHSFKREVDDYISAHSCYITSKLLLFKALAYDLYS